MHPEQLAGLSSRDREMMGVENGEVPRGPRHALALERERIRKNKEAMLAMGDLTADDRRMLTEIDQPIFAPDEFVRVARSSGEVEDGWKVAIPLNEKGRVVVGKGNAVKAVPELKLAELNPGGPSALEGQKEERRAARNFESGEKVRVRRSNGEIEEGWEIVNVEDPKKVLVHKMGKFKGVRRSDLEQLNPEPS